MPVQTLRKDDRSEKIAKYLEISNICSIFAADKTKLMMRLEHIYEVIALEGFTDIALQEINDYIKNIQNGTEDFPRFNLSEHAGLSKGGAPLIGAGFQDTNSEWSCPQGAHSPVGGSPGSDDVMKYMP